MAKHNRNQEEKVIKGSGSFSTDNIRHIKRALILMSIYPLIILALATAVFYFSANNKDSSGEAQQTLASTVTPETIATGLDTVWSMQFAPDGRMYFTERAGRIRVFENGQVRGTPIYTVPRTETLSAEEGLQGMALDPNFMGNGYMYIYYTSDSCSIGMCNRVARLTLNPSNGTLVSAPTVILDNIRGFQYHNGGRMKIGPDNKLYVAVGDGADNNDTRSKAAQDLNSLSGKMLRLNIPDGSAPGDNPFFDGNPNSSRSKIWSLGHRNPQGIAWHPTTGQMWITEHGPTGTPCCRDEVNVVTKGGNYGWPKYTGRDLHPNGAINNVTITVNPVIYPVWDSGNTTKWAPGGGMFYSGNKLGSPWTNSFIFTGLGFSGSARELYRLRLASDGRTPTQLDRLYTNQYGRLRDVVQGTDGAIYMATSNRDGRGSPISSDDRIIRLRPNITTSPTPPPPAPTPPAPSPTPPPPSPPASPGQSPYGGTAKPVPGRIEAEDYDNGGQDIAYYDRTAANEGGQYRNDGVDIERSSEGGYNVGWNNVPEWREHTVNVQAGTYSIAARVASAVAGGQLVIKLDGQTIGMVNVPNTGGWQTYTSVTLNNVNLAGGNNKVLRFETAGNSHTVNWVNFTRTSTSTNPSPSPSPTPTSPPSGGISNGSTSKPPTSVPGASPSNPVSIPKNIQREPDGSIIADFDNDGLNDIVFDSDNDGLINPETEIAVRGSDAPELTLDPLGEFSSGESSTISIKAGPLPEVRVEKPIAYTFAATQIFALSGLGFYLAVTKLAFLAAVRRNLGW